MTKSAIISLADVSQLTIDFGQFTNEYNKENQ